MSPELFQHCIHAAMADESSIFNRQDETLVVSATIVSGVYDLTAGLFDEYKTVSTGRFQCPKIQPSSDMAANQFGA